MYSLKSLCLLKVSQLNWHQIGIIPNTLRVELEKMKVFNGNWFGYQRDEDIKYEKATVLTIQYLGEENWAFQIRYAAVKEEPEELFDFVLKEDNPTKIGWSICRGLSSLGKFISLSKISAEEKQAVSTELTVDKDHPSKLVFKTTRRVTTELPSTITMVYNNKFQIDLDLNNSRVLTHGFFVGTKKGKPITGELPSGMVECAVSAKDAFLGRLVKANRGEMDGNSENVGSDSEEQSSSEDEAEEFVFEEDTEDPDYVGPEEDYEDPEDAGPVEDVQAPSFD